jgi:CHAT domain-containing protein/Tfp pilus assembly protein PilF
MLTSRYVLVFLITSLLTMAGLFGITVSDNSVPQKSPPSSQLLNDINDDDKYFSKEFYHYENLIINSELNKSIDSEINNLADGFEKDYLVALLYNRNKEFNDAYNLLVNQLNSYPPLYFYYDLLVQLASITNNLDEISNRIKENDKTLKGYQVYLIGMIEYTKGNYSKAIEHFSSLINEGIESKEIYYVLAYTYRSLGNYEKGLEELNKAEKFTDSSSFYYSKIINAKGSLYYLSGEYDIAQQNYQTAYDNAVEKKNVVEEIKALTNLAIMKDLYGDAYSAREYFNKALLIARKIENHNLIALLHSELGVSYTYTNNIVEARKNYEKSYEIYSSLKNNERLSYLSSNIASIYLQQTNYKYALKYYNEGLEFAGNNLLGKIMSITGIADVYSNEANYTQALKFYQQAKQLADSIKDVSSLVKINGGLGALFFNINRPYKSLEFFEEAKSNININEMPFEATELYFKIGTVLTSIDSLELAIDYFINGIKIAETTGDIYYDIILNTELAHAYYKLDDINKAKALITAAIAEAEKYDLKQIIGLQNLYLGKFLEAEGATEVSIQKYKASFEISGNAADYNTQIDAGFSLAKIFEQRDENEVTEEWYLKTVKLIENISFPLVLNQQIQISHFSGLDEVFNSLTEFYINHNKITDAFGTIERARSRNTMLNLNKLKLLSSNKDEEKFNEYIDLEWMISSGLYDKIVLDSLKKKYLALNNYFEKNDKSLDYYLSKNPSHSVKEIKGSLEENENLITIYVCKEFIQLFSLTNKKLSAIKIEVSRDSLISLLERVSPLYRTDLARREIYINQDLFSFNAEASWKLYNVIFRKMFEGIPASTTLIFSLPSELFLMPVEFLLTEWREDESSYFYKNKEFLINKYPVLYTPSASIYVAQKEKELDGNDQNLLVGDPNITNDDFTISYRSGLLEDNDFSTRNINLFPLEYSEAEIENINDVVSNGLVFLSEEATETNFKLNAHESKIIHLSTHSLLYKDQPLIIFSQQPDRVDDGYLEVGEILQLNLKSELIVLSSCRSGLGKIDEAEGIIGMQKAFFEAGASSIIVSLWDVNDKYTSYFMKEFYEFLSKGLDKPEALRQAKLSFINKYSANPYYWAAFVLSGNPSGMKTQSASTFSVFSYFLIILFIMLIVSLLYFKGNRRTN